MLREQIKVDDPDRYEESENKNGFYIAYLLSDIVTPLNKRKPIPSKVRVDLWRKCFNDEIVGECWVCSCKINYNDFQAGHMVAVANGGTDSIQNLKPVCGPCNRGTIVCHHYHRHHYL